MSAERKTETSASSTTYTITSKLGSGAYAHVYEVQNAAGDAKALKVDAEASVGEYQWTGVSTLMEIDIMCRLRHPHLMQAEEFLVNKCFPTGYALVMPLAKKHLHDKGWTVEQKISAFYQLASALHFLHQNHILHLDITLGNVLMEEKSGHVFLCDLGLAKSAMSPEIGVLSFDHEYLNTIYRPPENLAGCKMYSVATDIWSLGLVMLYSLLGVSEGVDPSPLNHLEWYKKWFASAHLASTLTHWLSKSVADAGQCKQLVNLLSGMLAINPHERLSMSAILSHPLFHLPTARTPITGTVLSSSAPAVADQNFVSIQRILDLFRNDGCYQVLPVRVLFLAIDLAYRTLHLVATSTRTEEILAHNIACIWMACKYYIGSVPLHYLLGVMEGHVKEDTLLKMELRLLDAIRGRIYRSFLYDSARTEADLVEMINKIVPYTREYTAFEPAKWSEKASSSSSSSSTPYIPKDVVNVSRLLQQRHLTP